MSGWLSWIGVVVAGLLVVGFVLWGGLIVAMRTKFEPALTAIRRMNRRFANPRVLKTAGKPGASAVVIHHVGRSTGRPYATPIAVADTEDGFVVALPYGTSPDWLKNIRAAGSATIDRGGRTYSVTDPRVVSAADVAPYLSAKERRTHRVYGVDQFLVVTVMTDGTHGTVGTRVAADVLAGDPR